MNEKNKRHVIYRLCNLPDIIQFRINSTVNTSGAVKQDDSRKLQVDNSRIGTKADDSGARCSYHGLSDTIKG